MTKAELIEAVHRFDLIIQPDALYCNPADETEIKEIIPESVKLIPIAFIEKGKMVLVDRAENEKDLFGGRA